MPLINSLMPITFLTPLMSFECAAIFFCVLLHFPFLTILLHCQTTIQSLLSTPSTLWIEEGILLMAS